MIRGIAWDHQRCWGPLDASVAPYSALTGQDIQWDRRSLFSFGEGDVADFTDHYDLIIFDHPFVGEICDRGLFLDLSAFLSDAEKAQFAADAIGASWASYGYKDGVWGLPIDVAAQTAAWRPDIMEKHELAPPETIEDVITLAQTVRAFDCWVPLAGKPTDLFCMFMTLSASSGISPGQADDQPFMARGAAREYIDILRHLMRVVHPRSHEWNPIHCLDEMRHSNDLVYTPYLFNYVNYAAVGAGQIRFGAPPKTDPAKPASTLLGGAGIGISAKSADPKAAFEYAKYLCAPETQSGLYVAGGGQPGSRTAWLSDDCNLLTNGFFADTLATMDNAFLRPTHPGFIEFFHEATLRIAAVVNEDAALEPFLEWLNRAFDDTRYQRAAAGVATK